MPELAFDEIVLPESAGPTFSTPKFDEIVLPSQTHVDEAILPDVPSQTEQVLAATPRYNALDEQVRASKPSDLPFDVANKVGGWVDALFAPGQDSGARLVKPEVAKAGLEALTYAVPGAREAMALSPKAAGIVNAVEGSVAEGVSGASSLEGIASLPAFAIPGVAEAYAVGVLSKLPDQYGRVREAVQQHGLVSAETAKAAADAGIQDLMGFLAVKGSHLLRGKGEPASPASASESAPATEPPPLPESAPAREDGSPEATIPSVPEPPVPPERWKMPKNPEPGTEAAISELQRQLGPDEPVKRTNTEPSLSTTSGTEDVGLVDASGQTEAPPVASEIFQPHASPSEEPAFGSRFVADMGLGLQASSVPGFETFGKPWVDAVKGFVSGVKSAVDFAKTSGQRDEVSAKFDAATNMAGMVARQARRHVELAGSDERIDSTKQALRQQAATFVRQANGDKAGMLAKLDAIRGKGYDAVIEYAKRNWDALEPVADAAKQTTDAAFKEAETANVPLDYRDNYVKGAYDFPAENKVIFDDTSGGRGTGTSFKKPKVFNDYAEAIAAGFKPKELRLDMLSESAVNATLRAVNRKKWAQSLDEVRMPDGLPAVAEAKPNGTAPDGYRMVQVTPGNVIPVHAEIAPTVEALTRDSAFPKLLAHTSAFVKHNMLVFDIFHGSRFAQMQGAFERRIPSYQKGLSLLEFADADLSKAVQHGLITPKEAAWSQQYRPKLESMVRNGLNVGRISDAIYSDVVPLMPGAKQANRFIFEKLSRGVITQSAVTALERNARLHPDWSQEKLNRYTAKEVNTYYRNLGNQGVFKSKTFQDAARFFVFAPQWIEGLVRSEGRGYGQMGKIATTGKLGNIGAGMSTGLIAYFALSQLVNMVTRGHPTWDNPEPGHKFDAWIPDLIQGSNGFFVSPLSVFAETTHDAMKYTERGQEPLDVASQLATNKLHPQIRALRDLFGGKDFFGRPLYGWERVTQAAQDMAPIPLFARTGGYKGGAERQMLSTLGIKATAAPTSTNDVYQLASEFRKKNGITNAIDKVHIESDYAGLRRALQNGDMETAKAEYETLLKSKKSSLIDDYFKKYPTKPLSGKASTEGAFKRSLDRGQMEIYNSSLRERKEVADLFKRLKKP